MIDGERGEPRVGVCGTKLRGDATDGGADPKISEWRTEVGVNGTEVEGDGGNGVAAGGTTWRGCGGAAASTASVTCSYRSLKGEVLSGGKSSSSTYWKTKSPNILCHSGELKSGKSAMEDATVANQSSKTT